MKSRGASLVAENAVNKLVSFLEEYAQDITKKAMEIAQADKRKKITENDILDAQ